MSKLIAFGAVALIAVAALIWSVVATYATVEHVTLEPTREVERECRTSVSDGNGSTTCRWIVYAAGEVFENEDNLLLWKFNSADVANAIAPGNTYCARVNWFRVPFLSWHRNVISVRDGACTPQAHVEQTPSQGE